MGLKVGKIHLTTVASQVCFSLRLNMFYIIVLLISRFNITSAHIDFTKPLTFSFNVGDHFNYSFTSSRPNSCSLQI